MEINTSVQSPLLQAPIPRASSPPPLISHCKKCQNEVKLEYYFCPTCGTKLKQPPVSTSIYTQIKYYIGSIVLFPMGIVWGFRYLRDDRTSAKIIGMALILGTIIFGMFIAIWTVQTVNTVSTQINDQMRLINGGY